MFDDEVESFLALREAVPVGENLTAVWYRKVLADDGTTSWVATAWGEQSQSQSIRSVKDILSLPDSSDESWPIVIAPVAVSAPEPIKKGVLESDPIAPLVDALADPRPFVEMLEDAGWKAAWIDPLEGVIETDGDPEIAPCSRTSVLTALANSVVQAASPSADINIGFDCGFVVIRCSRVTATTAWGVWTCGPWIPAPPTPRMNCMTQCNYEREVWRIRYRSVVEYNCITGTPLGSYWQWQREHGWQRTSTEPINGGATVAQAIGGCPLAVCPLSPLLTPDNDPTCVAPSAPEQDPWKP